MEAVGVSDPAVYVKQVDVPGTSNFDEAASKLKKAMEVAMK